ncbi:MAG: cation:proton antiporter [Eggerthellaceae bacterium]|jgi:Na+/H+ antiporter
MESFELILLVAAAILVSSVLDRLIPRISPPLIQIVLGFLIAYFAVSAIPFSLNPDYFLFIFIAPLLFHDAKEADRAALWTNRRKIISLSIFLVFAIMLVVGFALHSLVAAIPIAAALAVGAALGPTDAVAVSSLKGTMRMTRSENALLSGEALINDASGVVAFEFAIRAAVTDNYGIAEGILSFLLLFFGGIVVGVVMALIIRFIQTKTTEAGIDSITFYTLLDVLSPFIIYLVAEMTATSGIIAVVAAGLFLGHKQDRQIGPSVARLNIVTSSVWELLAFVLNGIIFIMLGMQLCWIQPHMSGADALFGGTVGTLVVILLMTAVLVAIRFAWIFIMERWHKNPLTGERPRITRSFIRSILALTLGGPKGAVTLSIIMSIPYVVSSGASFPYRDQLIFLTSGIILVTLLLANFLLPVVSPRPKEGTEFERNAEVRVDILRSVILGLSDQMTERNAAATHSVIRMYNDRIQRIGLENESEEEEQQRKLELEIVKMQEDYLKSLVDSGDVDPMIGYRYGRRIMRRDRILTHHPTGPNWYFFVGVRHARRFFYSAIRSLREWTPGVEHPADDAALRDLEIQVAQYTLEYLDDLLAAGTSSYPPELIGEMQSRYSRNIVTLQHMHPSITFITRLDDNLDEVMRTGYHLELEQINKRFEENEISRSLAKKLRDNVHLMQLDLDDQV